MHILSGYQDNLVLIQEQIESLIANISGVEAITNALRKPRREVTNYEQLATEVQVGYILNGYLNIKGLVPIHVFGEEGAHYQVGDTLDSRLRPVIRDQIRLGALDAREWVHWTGITENINEHSTRHHVLVAAKALFTIDRESLERRLIGTLAVNYSIDQLAQLFEKDQRPGRVFLIDQNGRYIYHPRREWIGRKVDEHLAAYLHGAGGHEGLGAEMGDLYLTHRHIERSGWILVSGIPADALLSGVRVIRNATIGIFTLALIFVVLVALYFSRSVVSPIRYVTQSFKRLKKRGPAMWHGCG